MKLREGKKKRSSDDESESLNVGITINGGSFNGHHSAADQIGPSSSSSSSPRGYLSSRWNGSLQRTVLIGLLVGTIMLSSYYLYLRSFDEKAVVLEIMQCTHDAFKKHDIPYFLDYGSLLGAIRHKGYIPWDDLIDIDVGVFTRDTQRIKDLKPEIQKCGYYMIHRDDVSHLPSVTSFVIRRGAFRIFYNAFTPLYVDIADYEESPLTKSKENPIVTDLHHSDLNFQFPESRVLPVRDCEFEKRTFWCPADSEWVLAQEYGDDWRTPKHNFKPEMVNQANQAAT